MIKKKILIVDDELDMADFLKLRFEQSGYEVMTANDGIAGLSMAEQSQPDLILLDVGMAQMDGHTLIQEIRKKEGLRDTPVIVLTAYDTMKDIFEVEGISDYITKPFDHNDLLARVRKVLGE